MQSPQLCREETVLLSKGPTLRTCRFWPFGSCKTPLSWIRTCRELRMPEVTTSLPEAKQKKKEPCCHPWASDGISVQRNSQAMPPLGCFCTK